MSDQRAVEYVRGERAVPVVVKHLVEVYRGYEAERGELVSYPKHKDDEMNRVFDAIVTMDQYLAAVDYQEVVNS